mmetsp:Transcript_21590/g.32139  ORF Transcript_21590/g.32139 Transcript_21590/m.32139 type:complete len:252 (-) Transcript_21590:2250-3005(-)
MRLQHRRKNSTKEAEESIGRTSAVIDWVSIMIRPLCNSVARPRVRTALARRSFFASSTDHSELLRSAEIHKFDDERDTLQYVLAAQGMDRATVKSVKQLHLARIFVDTASSTSDDAMMMGAKVVNKTLGTHAEVCGRLVEAILEEGTASKARSTLHGLADWIETNDRLSGLSDDEKALIEPVLSSSSIGESEEVKAIWKQLAMDYVATGLGEEVALYQAKGATLLSIDCDSPDSSEYASTCGGAMAILDFE